MPATRLVVRARKLSAVPPVLDGADVFLADFEFLQERLEEIVRRSANARDRDGFAD